MVGRPVGGKKYGGRKKGTPNLLPAQLRKMIIGVLVAETRKEEEAINPWLADLKRDYVPVYAGLLSRVIPKEMPVEATTTIKEFTLNMLGLGVDKHAISSTLPKLERIGVDSRSDDAD